jgi:phage baseplate assembly protein W
MPTLQQAEARSPWRVRLVFDVAPGAPTTPGTYALARTDGAGPAPAVARVLPLDTASVELVLAEGLLPALLYTLTVTGASGTPRVSYRAPDAQALGTVPDEDPEAEAFGLDVDWLAPTLAPGGDLPTVRGRACLVHDLAAVAVTRPGELFHRPEVGAALPQRVNGPNTPADLLDARAGVKRAWLADDRVRGVELTATAATDGTATLTGKVQSVIPEEPVDVTVRGT